MLKALRALVTVADTAAVSCAPRAEPDWVRVSPLPGNMSCSCTATGSEEVEGVALVAAASVEAAEASAPVELDADASATAAVVLVEERQGVPVLERDRVAEGEAGGE